MFKRLIHIQYDFGATTARIFAGLVMFPHGAQKALGWFGGNGFSGTMDFFTASGLPWIVALLVIGGEFLGSLGMIFGAFSRVAAFGFAVIMSGAIFMGHAQNGFFMNWFGNQKGVVFEYHLLMIGLALVVMIRGAGAWSIDRWLDQR